MIIIIQANLDMTDSMRPGKLVRHMQNLSYTYDTYVICMGLGPSISSVIVKSPSYSGPSHPRLPVSVILILILIILILIITIIIIIVVVVVFHFHAKNATWNICHLANILCVLSLHSICTRHAVLTMGN